MVAALPTCAACLLVPVCVVLCFYAVALFELFRLSVAPTPATGAQATGWFTLAHFHKAIFDDIYFKTLTTTFTLSAYVTLAAVFFGYLIAFKIVRTQSRILRTALILSIVIPFLTNIIVRMYGMSLVLSNTGVINTLLVSVGLLDDGEVFSMVRNQRGVTIGLVSFTLPFVTFVMATAFRRIDQTLEDAAKSLGAGPIETYFKVTLPLSMPGVVGGSVLAFSLSVSAFVTPLIIGQGNVRMIANAVYDQVLYSENKPLGAALSVIALVLSVLILYLQRLLVGPRYGAATP